jgi:hypothetical protein
MTNAGNGVVNECLQDDTGLTVTQHFCDPTGASTHQLWLPISLGGDGYKFENLATGLCLWAFEVGPSHNGVPITLSDCAVNDTNSRWAWDPFPFGPQAPFLSAEAIQSRVAGSTGYCLDVPGASTAIGLEMQLFGCNETNAQIFLVTQRNLG